MNRKAARIAIIIATATVGAFLGYGIARRPMAAHCAKLARMEPGKQCTHPADGFVVLTPLGAILGAATGAVAVHFLGRRSRPAV